MVSNDPFPDFGRETDEAILRLSDVGLSDDSWRPTLRDQVRWIVCAIRRKATPWNNDNLFGRNLATHLWVWIRAIAERLVFKKLASWT